MMTAQWRLLDAAGVLRWAPDREFDAERLTRILDDKLATSRAPDLVAVTSGPEIGSRLEVELAVGRCPPIPLGRPNRRLAHVLFADTGPASAGVIDRLASQTHSEKELVAVVVRDASTEQADAIAAKFGGGVPVLPDPSGAISRRAGIGWTPTVVVVDGGGRVTELITDSESARRADTAP